MKQTGRLFPTLRRAPWLLVLLAALSLVAWTTAGAGPTTDEPAPTAAKSEAPDFPPGLDWLNTDRPLRMPDLRGKVVLLHFWTYCYINCMDCLPYLKGLERKYGDALVVVGVHSAKFDEERDTENLRQAVLRDEIDYPVVNDKDMIMWRAYGVRAWPTVVLISPEGKILNQFSGESSYEALDHAVAQAVGDGESRGKLNLTPVSLRLERTRIQPSFLSYPGKVLADAASQRLFISDANHNRIVVVSLKDDSVLAIIGRGPAGLSDGSFETAQFNHPRGLALDANGRLYVADTENHAIRRVDLRSRTVTTIAGTGQMLAAPIASGAGTRTPLCSPWDLLLWRGSLYIAMAGMHQVWQMDLQTGKLSPFAGSGREARVDGPRAAAALAQPSGIATDGRKLYLADSEASSIRAVDLDGSSRVETLTGGDLYDFGDQDGKGQEARLQHPLGVAYADGVLYVADTYNQKIKRITLSDGDVKTILGTGEAGLRDGDRAQFREPSGLSVADGKLYIADTNNQVIRVADLASGQVHTLQIRGESNPQPSEPEFSGQVVELPAQTVAPGQVTVVASVQLPPAHTLNRAAPNLVKVRVEGAPTGKDGLIEKHVANPTFPLNLPVKLAQGKGKLSADLDVYYCRDDAQALCLYSEARVVVPLKVDAASKNRRVTIRYAVPSR